MKLVPAKCPFCGGTLQVDPGKEAAVCEFCKQPFIVEKAITNYNTTVINNHNFDGANIHVDNVNLIAKGKYGDISFIDLFNMGENAIDVIKDYNLANEIGEELIRHNNKDFRGYYIKGEALYGLKADPKVSLGYLCRAYDLVPDDMNQKVTLGSTETSASYKTDIRVTIQLLLMDYYPVMEKSVYDEIGDLLVSRQLYFYRPLVINIDKSCSDKRISVDGLEFEGDGQIAPHILVLTKHKVCSPWKVNYVEPNIPLIDMSQEPIFLDYELDHKLSKYRLYIKNKDGTRMELDNGYAAGKNGCYVATCVYGSYDCPQVWVLRRYRDNYLDERWWGRLFIHLYYFVSPKIIKLFGKTRWFRTLNKSILDKKVEKLKEKGYQTTAYKDKY